MHICFFVKKEQNGEIAKIHQDLTIYLSDLDKDHSLTFVQQQGRKIFLFVIDGSLTLQEGTLLHKRDSVRITEISQLEIKATTDSRFMLIDLPY